LEPEVREIVSKSELFKDSKRLNVFAFVLDSKGLVIHQFHGVPGGRAASASRSDYRAELTKAIAKIKLPKERDAKERAALPALPDLQMTSTGLPAGVRLFLRQEGLPLAVVETVPMGAKHWQPLALPDKVKKVDAELLKDWLIWLYPPAIRAADEAKQFQKFTGDLTLEPAGTDKSARYALLRGGIRLTKSDDKESAFEGTMQIVLTYSLDDKDVKSVRGAIEGDYLYRPRSGTQRMPLKVAIESRPE
jgi:hypothetical protein